MLALMLSMALAQVAAKATPVWEYRESADAATGAKAAWAIVRDPDAGSRLIVRCDAGTESIISVQFMPKTPLAIGTTRVITITLDSSMAEMANWELPGRGAYVDDPATVFIYVSSFAKAKRLQVGLVDDAGQPIGGDFAGPGDDSNFKRIYAACGREYAMPSALPGKKK